MAKERIRMNIEVDGTKIRMEGNVTLEKIQKIFEAMNIADIEAGSGSQSHPEPPNMDSTGAKIWHAVDKYFSLGKFTSTDVLEKYEDEFNEPIKLSVISTYLSRFSARGRLDRVRTGREWTYQTNKIAQQH